MIRPLRRIGPGHWESRDQEWTFLSGRAFSADGANADTWHIYYSGEVEAWGDREPTLRDAVDAVESALSDSET